MATALRSTWTRGTVAPRRCTHARTLRSNIVSPAGSWTPLRSPAAVFSDACRRGARLRAAPPGTPSSRRACVACPATRISAMRPIPVSLFRSCTASLIRPIPAACRATISRTRRTGSRVPTSGEGRDPSAPCPIQKGTNRKCKSEKIVFFSILY